MITTTVSILGLIGAFVAGWLAATDKVRVELYKRKLEAYDEIISRLQELAVISIAQPRSLNLDDGVVMSARIALIQERLKQIIYISKNVEQAVGNFDTAGLEPEAIFKKMNEIAKYAAEDLQIKRHDFVTKIVAGEIKALQQQHTAKEKTREPGK